MIVQASIDETGSVAVHIDSDGDQGDAWSTEVLDDMLNRASQRAIALWLAAKDAGE